MKYKKRESMTELNKMKSNIYYQNLQRKVEIKIQQKGISHKFTRKNGIIMKNTKQTIEYQT